MISLEINNSTSKITGLDTAQQKQIRNLLSYSMGPKAKFFSGHFGSGKIPLIDRHGNFPTGLLYIVNDYINSNNIKILRRDLRRRPKKIENELTLNLGHITPYPEQEQAAVRASQQSRGILSVPTGVGKTLIAALIINKIQMRTLVVVPSLELKSQITTAFTGYFGKDRVGSLGADIAIENVDALDPKVVVDYDCVIIDEFHHSGSKTYRKLNKTAWAKIYYRFGLTATPFRNQDHEELLLKSILSRKIINVSYATAVRHKYIVPVTAFYIELPKKQVSGRTWPQVYKELVTHNEQRNQIIASFLLRLKSSNISTLCLVKEIAHGNNILIPICRVTNDDSVFFVKGDNDNNKHLISKFNSKACSCLIGTNGILGEGVDTKPTEFVVIAGLGKSKGQFMQQVGRGVRNYPGKANCIIIIFKDPSHKWTKDHFNQQVKFLKDEYGVVPAKLEDF